jgi:hypothetical protein
MQMNLGGPTHKLQPQEDVALFRFIASNFVETLPDFFRLSTSFNATAKNAGCWLSGFAKIPCNVGL